MATPPIRGLAGAALRSTRPKYILPLPVPRGGPPRKIGPALEGPNFRQNRARRLISGPFRPRAAIFPKESVAPPASCSAVDLRGTRCITHSIWGDWTRNRAGLNSEPFAVPMVCSRIAMKRRRPRLDTITVNIPPYGRMTIVGQNGDNALSTLRANWPKLWPAVKRDLKSMLRRYEQAFEAHIRLKGQKWAAEGSRTDPECFMGDQADLFLRIQLEEPPDWDEAFPAWDFFIKETSVVHSQPVF